MSEPTYSMRVVTRMTGISADTIRKWESRHLAIQPDRSDGNTRRFSAGDVRRLNLLRELTERGHRIGDLANLRDDQLVEMLGGAAHVPERTGRRVDTDQVLREEYLRAVRAYDTRRTREVLSRASASMDFHEMAHRFILPVLRETGERWASGDMSVGQEHFLTAQMRGLITMLLQMIPLSARGKKVVIATPAGHRHELGAQVAAVLAASHGFEPIYLGPDLPHQDVLQAVEESGAELVMLSVIREIDAAERRELARCLRTISDRVSTWVGLPHGHSLAAVKTGARLFHHYDEMELALQGL